MLAFKRTLLAGKEAKWLPKGPGKRHICSTAGREANLLRWFVAAYF